MTNKELSKLTDVQISQEIKRFQEELDNRNKDRNAEQGLFENEICLTYSSYLYKLKYKLSRKTPMKDLHETQRKRRLKENV